ncbi:reverse transcriptase domain-containing protein [Tanacetum coccineum]
MGESRRCYLTDRDSVQTPVYFVSKALKETELNYSAMEKLILALVFAAKKNAGKIFPSAPNSGNHRSTHQTGLILTNPEGMEFTYALRFEFTATNNEAEYEALIAALCIAARMGVPMALEARGPILAEYVLAPDFHAGSCSMQLRTTDCSSKSLQAPLCEQAAIRVENARKVGTKGEDPTNGYPEALEKVAYKAGEWWAVSCPRSGILQCMNAIF